mgnify:CR=1 FL=1
MDYIFKIINKPRRITHPLKPQRAQKMVWSKENEVLWHYYGIGGRHLIYDLTVPSLGGSFKRLLYQDHDEYSKETKTANLP